MEPLYCCTCNMYFVISCSKPMQNYMVFNDVEGIYTYTFEYERKVYLNTSQHFHALP